MFGAAKIRFSLLDGDSPVVFTGARRVTVRCLAGALWATAEGGREVALVGGESGAFSRPGKVVLVGMPSGEAVVEVG